MAGLTVEKLVDGKAGNSVEWMVERWVFPMVEQRVNSLVDLKVALKGNLKVEQTVEQKAGKKVGNLADWKAEKLE
jgi:hypothetical protein